ncbi:hypothetical protein FSW04_12685 [Baekduia soli]|uniref:Cutinase family protein n=1 Tax=Baekduia soli TaxID=496014 RepID=A0A5B8U675_9ACTN|nr:hypothetical protein [Baekduia soli]QEC48338.1 hypothetical protein FSW04_12685 [Baekduia soli]
MIRAAAVALTVAGVLAVPAAAPAAEPALTVTPARLHAALQCWGRIGPHAPAPIVFAPGTGSDGSQVHTLGGPAFARIGHPYCAVTFPQHATADLQVSVQYLVAAIRTTARRAGRPVAVAGVSQGGLLARMALTVWPSLRARVSDVVSVSGTQHGAPASPSCATQGCPPAFWQQAQGSNLLRALNNGRDETPGRDTAWTTVRSATDEIVRPQTGAHPTSALRGASNILIQSVCPGRQVSHLATTVDSVTLAVLRDAVRHAGPARASRLPRTVCSHPYGDGLDPTRTARFLALAPAVVGQSEAGVPTVTAEPPVRAWLGRPRSPKPSAVPSRPVSAQSGTPVAAAPGTTPAPATPAPAPIPAPAPVWTVPVPPGVASFTDTYRDFDVYTDEAQQACSETEGVYGAEPAAAGRYPVLVYVHGSAADWEGNLEGQAVAAAAAAQGFVVAAFTYDSTATGLWPPFMDGHARCMFDAAQPGNGLAKVCARAKADCSRGVLVSGFSQGGVIAALARNHSAMVRAAWLIGVNTPIEAATLAAPSGTRALPDDRVRITIGRADVDTLDALNQLTGQSCAASPCLRADGSGYDVVEHSQVADGFADHCFWESSTPSWPYWSCASPPTFDPGFASPSTLPWSLATNLTWLRGKLG